jgi:hypothetical protein
MSADIVSIASVASAVKSAVSNVSANSAGGSATGLQNVINLLSNKISQVGGGTGSVTSAEATASVRSFSAAGSAGTSTKGFLQSIVNVISNTFSNAFSAGSVISSDLASVKSVLALKAPWAAARVFTISNLQSIAASALTDVSGLVLTVAADETWKFEGMLLIHVSGSPTAGLRMGFSVPPLSAPKFAVFDAISVGASQSAPGMRAGGALQVSGSSVILSLTSSQFAGAASAVPINFEGIFNVASGGTFRVQAAVVASASQSPVHINGGYMMAFRLK